jgi:hypothetical protein
MCRVTKDYPYRALFRIRGRHRIKKTMILWAKAFNGDVDIRLPLLRFFNIKKDSYAKGFNPFENHILYKLDKRLYLAYQATKYQLADVLGIFPEVYFLSDLTEFIFFRIRHRGDPEYGYNGGFKGFVIQFFKDLKFTFDDYAERRGKIISQTVKKLKTKLHSLASFFSTKPVVKGKI